VDEIDREILRLLAENARRPIREIAAAVKLSSAPVTRRIERLQQAGVIERYTTVVNYTRTGTTLEAFTEVRIQGAIEVAEVWAEMEKITEVVEMFTIAGDPDALIRLRVDNVEHLQSVVNKIRGTGKVVGTKTLIVLDTWKR
jgi:Lrp/AsnC family leucine-responsive transcriptional regulator